MMPRKLISTGAILLVTLLVLKWALGPRLVIFTMPSGNNILRTLTSRFSTIEWNSTYYCQVGCKTNTPCEYLDEVDLRVIVITFDRPESLKKCLDHVKRLDTLGDHVSVEIWIDRPAKGTINQETFRVASEFQEEVQRGVPNMRACVHNQTENAGIIGQWTDTWRPRSDHTREIGLILEDDVDVAPMAYRWLKAVHRHYDHRTDLAGYTLQMDNIQFLAGKLRPMSAPSTDPVFMYGVLGTWGYSPHPKIWREYQKWSHVARNNGSDIKPYVPGLVNTGWYRGAERNGRAWTVWEMWHIYYCYINHFYSVYSNLEYYSTEKKVFLGWNRKEPGLHFHGTAGEPESQDLMSVWNNTYVKFPNTTIQFCYNGTVARRV